MPLSVYANDVGISYHTSFRWFKSGKIQVRVIINQREQPASVEEALAKDVWESITIFSARLYGSRSHKNKQRVETLRQAAESL